MRLYSNITPCILWLIIKVCKGVTTVNFILMANSDIRCLFWSGSGNPDITSGLFWCCFYGGNITTYTKNTFSALSIKQVHFASSNCDEDDRKITEKKSYNLTWNGQITPKLCSFSFTGGETFITDTYEICFHSIVYRLPQSMGNVQVKITNYTRTAWDYNHDDPMIPHTCVKNAYKMVVSILVPTGYTEPSPKIYLQLNITANIVEETVPEKFTIEIVLAIGFFVLLITCACCCGIFMAEPNCCKNVCDVLGECYTLLCVCITCKCLRERSFPSCEHDCNDICRPCGHCCSAWAGCCTTLVMRAQGDHANNNSTTVETEMDEMLVDSGHTAATTLTSDVVHPPPSYNSIKDVSVINDPTLPPSSYEE